MKVHTTNYQNTFIEVAEDCPVDTAEVPVTRIGKETVASLQYFLIKNNPYQYTSDEVLFTVHAQRNALPQEELLDARRDFFSKGQACLRASPLGKRYGWGIHFDDEGKVALFGRENIEYEHFLKKSDLPKLRAMRSRRK